MTDVRLAYGRDGIVARVPDDAVVVTATDLPGLADEADAVVDALRAPVAGPPLAELVRTAARGRRARRGRMPRVAVVFPDITRPMPNRTVLPPLLAELERAGIGPDARRAPVRHRHAPRRHSRGDGRARGPGAARPLSRPPAPTPRRRDHVEVGRVDGVAVGSTAATSRPMSAS